jgi:predicted DNA-binding transcriptional regulator AlpA
MGEEMLTLNEAAELAGKSRRTLERAVSSGRLPHDRQVIEGRDMVVVRRADVAELYGPRSVDLGSGLAVVPESMEVVVKALEVAQRRNDELMGAHEREVGRLEREVVSARRWGRGTVLAAALVLLGVAHQAWSAVEVAQAAERSISASFAESEVRATVESERASQARSEALEATQRADALQSELDQLQERREVARDFVERRRRDLEAMAAEAQR